MEFRHRLHTEDKIPYLIEVWNTDGIIKIEDTDEIYYLSDVVKALINSKYPLS